ncbi:hypothetical protein FKM82_031114 [Ascaphus truei]
MVCALLYIMLFLRCLCNRHCCVLRPGPPPVERPRVSAVTDSSVTISWSLHPHRHTSVAHVRLSLQHPTDRTQQAEQEPSVGEFSFR